VHKCTLVNEQFLFRSIALDLHTYEYKHAITDCDFESLNQTPEHGVKRFKLRPNRHQQTMLNTRAHFRRFLQKYIGLLQFL
jgi:hypothetical protein